MVGLGRKGWEREAPKKQLQPSRQGRDGFYPKPKRRKPGYLLRGIFCVKDIEFATTEN